MSLEGSGLPQVGRQGLKLSSRTALPFSWQQKGEWNSQSIRASLDLLPFLLLVGKASSLLVFREGSEKA